MYLSRGLGSTSSIPDQITQTALASGVPPSLALAVATQESGLNQSAVGSSGEIGVYQLMPATAAGLGVNPADLTQNIQGGVTYLKQLFNLFGDWATALMAYNGGPTNVVNGTVSPAAQSYASSVLAAANLDTPVPVPSQNSDALAFPDYFSSSDLLPSFSTGPSTPFVLALVGVGVLAIGYAASR